MAERDFAVFWPLAESIDLDSLTPQTQRLFLSSRNLFFIPTVVLINEATPLLKQSQQVEQAQALFSYIRTLTDLKKQPNLSDPFSVIQEANCLVLRRLTGIAKIAQAATGHNLWLIPRLKDIPSVDDVVQEELDKLVPEDFQPAFMGVVCAYQHFSQLVDNLYPVADQASY